MLNNVSVDTAGGNETIANKIHLSFPVHEFKKKLNKLKIIGGIVLFGVLGYHIYYTVQPATRLSKWIGSRTGQEQQNDMLRLPLY